MEDSTLTRAESLLKQMFGPQASFRDGQWEAIHEIAIRRNRVLVVQRTGWGKSLVYFLATKLLREEGAGVTLLISPLLSLMRNQIEMASRLGLSCATINSDNTNDWDRIESALAGDRIDILLVSPERLSNERFSNSILRSIGGRIGLFVIDETHCISDWGHDFRPDYRRIARILKLLPPRVPVLCTTATANSRVVADVAAQIGSEVVVQRGPLARTSLRLHNVILADQSERMAWIVEYLPRFPGSGIIYCLTVPDTRRVAEWLMRKGINCLPYYAGLKTEEKVAAEEALYANRIKALVATVALGMGFDKPDLGFVIHFQRPGSVISYYQQVGRAGRALEKAYGVLLSSNDDEDDEIQDYFIRTAFPPEDTMRQILKVIERGQGANISAILQKVNVRKQLLEKALKLLEVDMAIARDGDRFFRTPNRWVPDLERIQNVTNQRRREVEQMQDYVRHNGCLMQFLAETLDDDLTSACGHCMNCGFEQLSAHVPASLRYEAVEFLRNYTIRIESKKKWPPGISIELSGSIPAKLQPRTGRALSMYGDDGWGKEVARGKYVLGHFSEELVDASVTLIKHSWKPEPAPRWITAVPSMRHPELVYSFSKRLAMKLGLPFVPVLEKIRETAEQKTVVLRK